MEKIKPNFVNELSAKVESEVKELIDRARDLGVEAFDLQEGRDQIVEKVRAKHPERYDLVTQKLKDEGLTLEDLGKELFLDRMLGIDCLFKFQGRNYVVDATSGKHTVVVNKERKFQEMEELYKQLGIDKALIIKLKTEITEDIILDLFSKLETLEKDGQNVFTVVVKYPETPMKKRLGRL